MDTKRIAFYFALIKKMTPAWFFFRARYAFLKKSGFLRIKIPQKNWEKIKVHAFSFVFDKDTDFLSFFKKKEVDGPQFLFSNSDYIQWPNLESLSIDKETVIRQANAICQGVHVYFGCYEIKTGFFPDWHKNYFTGERGPTTLHWSKIDDFSFGDIKVIWEPSRFFWVYTLSRAYVYSKEERYAQVFWQLFENWLHSNPPNFGVNWKCGQEASIRLFAMLFGINIFLCSVHTTKQRMELFYKFVIQTGLRVVSNISYAMSQSNNHATSEAACLYLIGLLFPELRMARQFYNKGKKLLERLAEKLIDQDGNFSQHSANYQRLMLQTYLLCIQVGKINDDYFSNELNEKIQKSIDLILLLQDAYTGQLPNFGANDGSLIIPLNNCSFADYRPLVALGYACLKNKLIYAPGPWYEDALWFNVYSQAKPSDTAYPALETNPVFLKHAGYLLKKSKHYFFMMLVRAFKKHRPSQYDNFHIDFWVNGRNVLLDSGTFSYNSMEIDSAYQLHNKTYPVHYKTKMISRFLYFPWDSVFLNKSYTRENYSYYEFFCRLENFGNQFFMVRGILFVEDVVIIMDRGFPADEAFEIKYLLLNESMIGPVLELYKIEEDRIKKCDPVRRSANYAPHYLQLQGGCSISYPFCGRDIMVTLLKSDPLFSFSFCIQDKRLQLTTQKSTYQFQLIDDSIAHATHTQG